MYCSRREFIKILGMNSAVLPFLGNLPSLGFANTTKPKQRLVIIFSPNGTVTDAFWPDEEGPEFTLKPILEPLVPFRNQLLILNGVCDRVRGDGDNHMRGIGCLLTGIELFPGNIQGGSHTPAGWARGISIDQEIKNYLQRSPETRTRFGSLEFGVMVPERADTWTRMVYAGPNQPVTPIDDPYQMFQKLYGRHKDNALMASVLDQVTDDLQRLRALLPADDRQLLEQHATFVRQIEQELRDAAQITLNHPEPVLEPGVQRQNDQMPTLSRLQIELLVNSLANDFARIATLQYTNSVGQTKMKWVGVEEGHHELSHEPDSNQQAQDKLIRINRWFCEQVAYLAQRLAETPEPGGTGSLLDHTMIIWTNELGKGNSHTLDNIPFVLLGNGLGFKMGRSLKLGRTAHNRLLLSLAHAFGHHIETFGNPDFCRLGPLSLS